MITAVEIYEAFLIEIDRHESPDAQVVTFLHHWNTAVYSFIENELSVFELTNVVTDRLRHLSTQKELTVNAASCKAPETSVLIPLDYYRLFGVKGVFEYARDYGFKIKKGELIYKPFRKMNADLEGFVADNFYYAPAINRPFYRIFDNKINFLYGQKGLLSDLIFLKTLTISYIKHPIPLQLSDSFLSFNSSVFPIDVNRLILKIAVLDYMGSTGDDRVQIKSQL
jgi:hypothetical protein